MVCQKPLSWMGGCKVPTPPGAKLSTSVANAGALTRTASWAEYVVRASPVPAMTSTMGLFIKLRRVSSAVQTLVELCHGGRPIDGAAAVA
jgi:hypothetical protein